MIVNWNGLHHLQECLRSLRACAERLEIIVVDNGSTDGSVEYLEQQADVALVAKPSNLGFADGNNIGMQRCVKPRRVRRAVRKTTDRELRGLMMCPIKVSWFFTP